MHPDIQQELKEAARGLQSIARDLDSIFEPSPAKLVRLSDALYAYSNTLRNYAQLQAIYDSQP